MSGNAEPKKKKKCFYKINNSVDTIATNFKDTKDVYEFFYTERKTVKEVIRKATIFNLNFLLNIFVYFNTFAFTESFLEVCRSNTSFKI